MTPAKFPEPERWPVCSTSPLVRSGTYFWSPIISPFIFFRAFLGLFFSYYMTELLLANMPIAQQQGYALDQFVEIFLHGILAN